LTGNDQRLFSANAQDSTSNGPAGPFALDMTFKPAAIFDATAGQMFEMPLIKFRYFMTSDMAIRAALGIGYGQSKNYLDVDGNNYSSASNNSFTLAGGLEKHFGTGKFSPYLGAQASITNASDKAVTKIGDTETTTKNANGYISIGLNAVFGADIYILPRFYIGAEFTPGLIFTKSKDETSDGTIVTKGGSAIGFDLASSSGVKIGFRF
jgi:hypothetical protein